MPLPANTMALNPYARPSAPARAGEMPRGAQLLSGIRQAPGGGRDLYASPDGNVYRRRDDGWYRRQPDGRWDFFAPTQGQIARSQLAGARGGEAAGAGGVYRPVAGQDGAPGRVPPRGGRVPDTGFEARAQEIAALERQYYARSLGRMRAQNWRPAGGFGRPARPAGRRR